MSVVFRSTIVISLLALAACAGASRQQEYRQMYEKAGENQPVVDISENNKKDGEQDSDIASSGPQYVRMEDVSPTGEIRMYPGRSPQAKHGGEIDPETGMVIASGASVDDESGAPAADGSTYEITKVDITKIPGATGENITVLGIKLGDSKDKVLAKLGDSAKYDARTQTLATRGLLIKFDDNERVKSIGIGAPFKDNLAGRSAMIIGEQVFANERTRHQLIAPEDGIVQGQVTLPGGHSFTTITYQFFGKGMELSGKKTGNSYSFNYLTLVPVKDR